MRKKHALVAAALAVTLAAAACGSDSTPADDDPTSADPAAPAADSGEIWYSTKNSSELVHVAMADGVTRAAELLGFEGNVTVAEADAARQNDQMNNLIENVGPAAIVVNPYDSDSISDVMARANEAGIPIAVIDNSANNATADVAVLFDSLMSGQMAGEKAVELLTERYGEPRGVVVNLYGEVVSQVFRDRSEGFEAVIAEYPDIELISVLGAPQADVATSALNNIIADVSASGRTIDLINTPTDTATLGVVESLRTNGMWHREGEDGHVFIISHDGLGDILELVIDGYVSAEIVIDVYGVGGIATEILHAYPLQGEEVPTSGTFTPQGEYLNTEVTFGSGETGATVMLEPVVVDASTADNPLIWGNAGQ